MASYRNLIFLCDAGQASPRVIGFAREISRLRIHTYLVTPALNFKQKSNLGIQANESWTYLPIPNCNSLYKRDVGFRKFLFAPSRLFTRFMDRRRNDLLRESSEAAKMYKAVESVLRAKGLLERDSIIISSSGPFRFHILASELMHVSEARWVADYRDMWTLNHTNTSDPEPSQLNFECKTISLASGITTVSNDLVIDARKFFDGPILELQNGHPGFRTSQKSDSTLCRISYTGQVYNKFQKLDLFLDAIDEIGEHRLLGRIVFRFAGESVRDVRKYYKNKGIRVPGYILLVGVLGRAEALTFQSESDFLLAFKWDDPRFENIYSTKIYEYVSSGRPTLVFGTSENEASGKLVTSARAGVNLHTRDELQNFIFDRLKGTQYIHEPDISFIESLSYRQLANRLNKFLLSL